MEKNISIYELEDNKFGAALPEYQKPAFYNYGKVYLLMYNDKECTKPYLDAKGKHYVTLKNLTTIKLINN